MEDLPSSQSISAGAPLSPQVKGPAPALKALFRPVRRMVENTIP